jgi:hypothetical protein
MGNTVLQYESIIKICKDIFTKKAKDYGTAWRVLRTSSITDQIFIKAQRIRTIEEKGNQKIEEGVRSEYIGIVNWTWKMIHEQCFQWKSSVYFLINTGMRPRI